MRVSGPSYIVTRVTAILKFFFKKYFSGGVYIRNVFNDPRSVISDPSGGRSATAAVGFFPRKKIAGAVAPAECLLMRLDMRF